MTDEERPQLLYLVFGGELTAPQRMEFRDPAKLDIVGMFTDYDEAERAWRSKAQETVDSAHTRYFVSPLHKLLDPDGDGVPG